MATQRPLDCNHDVIGDTQALDKLPKAALSIAPITLCRLHRRLWKVAYNRNPPFQGGHRRTAARSSNALMHRPRRRATVDAIVSREPSPW